MNEFNVLLGAATNGTPSGSLFDALFARYIAPQESWRELESPLPITILAAGEDLIDYRIYGADGGVGVATENLLNPNIVDEEQEIRIESETFYTLSRYISGSGNQLTMATYDENGNKLWETYLGAWYRQPIYCDANAVLIKVYIPAWFKNAISLVKGYKSTPQSNPYPANYIPNGYKLPMVVTNGTATTTTPIYIGSDPLAEDEYVDFGEQKIYRMEGGTLAPTDPPVPIPALPTIKGETIIDYNPSETPAVDPEKMYIKYKPQ